MLEECDVGPLPDMGCDPLSCQVRRGYRCNLEVGASVETCHPVCGDGITVWPLEERDVCMYVCIYVCMYVCMCVYVCI